MYQNPNRIPDDFFFKIIIPVYVLHEDILRKEARIYYSECSYINDDTVYANKNKHNADPNL